MNLKSLNKNRVLRQILPSVFFIFIFVFLSFYWRIVPITGTIIALLIVHLILQNNIMGRILGVIFILGTLFMLVALLDDIIKGNATLGYIFGIFLVLLSFIMSVLLILGYKKNNKNSNQELKTQ